jgi:GNAT superfamily N-acetyltransferase
MKPGKITYKPVDAKTWKDLVTLFESKGGPHYCWCMVWRTMKDRASRSNEAEKKASLKNFITKKIPIGLLGYSGKEAIAWCSIGPRESFRELSGDNSLKDVWSLVCFYIKKEFRHQNIISDMIRAALKYAKRNGAKYVEGYPVDPDSPSYRFMGFKATFEKAGFNFSHNAGRRRNVMTIPL